VITGSIESERLVPQPAFDECETKLREDGRGSAPARDLEDPRRQAPGAEGDGEEREIRGNLGEGRSRECLRDDPPDQDRLKQDERGGRDPDGRVQDEQTADGPGAAHESLVQDAHGQPVDDPPVGEATASGSSTSSPVTRARKT